MRMKGIIKILIFMGVNFLITHDMFGIEAAMLVLAGTLLYAWLGEYIAIAKDSTIAVNSLNSYERSKLMNAYDVLKCQVKEKSGADVSGVKSYVVPTDQINAWAYGIKNVAISRACLSACDDMTLKAVLGHEISHILCLDAVFHRVIFANITVILVGLIIASFITVSFVWIIFLFLCLCGICGGILSIFFCSVLSKVIKGIYVLLQRLVLFIYQTVIGMVSRGCEFRADEYAVSLGYGTQLNYFLSRFVEGQECRQRTLREMLYDSHPATYKRIKRIEQYRG